MMVRIIFIVASLASVVGWSPRASAQIPISVVNSSFETGSAGDVPTGWTPLTNYFWIGDSSLAGADPGAGYAS